MLNDKQLNPALGTSHLMIIPSMKELTYHIQSPTLPGWTMAGFEAPYRNMQGALPSNRIDFNEISLSFQIDEDFTNWEGLLNWAYRVRTGNKPILDVMEDVTLVITDSNKRPKLNLVFKSAFPTTVGDVPLDVTITDAIPLVCNVNFRFQEFVIERPY